MRILGACFMTGGSEQVVIGLRWNRTRWVRFRAPLPFDGNPAAAYLAEFWNGTTWKVVPTPR